jgi:Tfp pilus assembly protein PilN
MVDLHKEIKLSDLFKRGSKSGDGEGNGSEPKPAKEPKSTKEPKPAKEPKPPKERKRRRERKERKETNGAALAAHEAPPPANVPLMRAFNLLPREEARAVSEGGAPSPLPYVLVALAGVLVFAALAAFYLMAGTDVTKKKGQVEDLRAELAAYQAQQKGPSVEDKSAELANERLSRTSALSSALTKRLAWERVLREFALVVPTSVTLGQIQGSSPTAGGVTTNADGTSVTNLTISGSTVSQADVALFMTRLSVIRELSAVQLKQSGDSPADPGKVAFTVTATLRSGP